MEKNDSSDRKIGFFDQKLALSEEKCKKFQFFKNFSGQIDEWRPLEANIGISVSGAFKKCMDVPGVRHFGEKNFFGLVDQLCQLHTFLALIAKRVQKKLFLDQRPPEAPRAPEIALK